MQTTRISIAIASLCAIGLGMSQQASAAVATAASGTGSLILAVVDSTTGATFFQDLGKPTASMTPTANASFVSDVHLDANYQALVAQAGTGASAHQLLFAVVGGANGANAPGGANDYLTTSGIQTYGPNQLTNANLRNFNLIDQNVNNALNGITESANNTFFVDPNNTVGGPTSLVAALLALFRRCLDPLGARGLPAHLLLLSRRLLQVVLGRSSRMRRRRTAKDVPRRAIVSPGHPEHSSIFSVHRADLYRAARS